MIALLAGLIISVSLVFYPAASQPNQPECPPNTFELEGIRAIAAGKCKFAQAAAPDRNSTTAPNQIDDGMYIYLPFIETGSAPQQESDEPPDIERSIDQPAAQEKYHIVQPGESLQKIARRHDTSVELLWLANPKILNPDLILVGARVRIPSPAETEQLRKEAAQRRLEFQTRVVANVPHDGDRWIDVDIQSQTVRAYEGETLMKTFVASTGRARTPTVTGQFRIWVKLRTDDMRGPGYDLKDVPYVMYFHKGYGLHGTYWHNNFGTPMSSGCVNLRTEDAAWLFDFSSIGMLVNVH